ncbi:hypothetical protein NSS70_10865 [Aeribacillus sp. FSL K6-2848]
MIKVNEKLKKYLAQGTLSFAVSKLINAGSENEAIAEIITKLNSFNIEIDEISIKTSNGEVVTLKVHDVDMDWESIVEDDE